MIETLPLFALPAPRGQLDALELLEDVAPPTTTGGPVPAAPVDVDPPVVLSCAEPRCRSTVHALPAAESAARVEAMRLGWSYVIGGPTPPRCPNHRPARR